MYMSDHVMLMLEQNNILRSYTEVRVIQLHKTQYGHMMHRTVYTFVHNLKRQGPDTAITASEIKKEFPYPVCSPICLIT